MRSDQSTLRGDPSFGLRAVGLRVGVALAWGVAATGCVLAASAEGILVEHVLPGNPGEKAGLLASDRILAIDDKPITGREQFEDVLTPYNPGDTVQLSVLRRGRRLELPLTFGARHDGRVVMGLTLADFTVRSTETFEPISFDIRRTVQFEEASDRVCPLYDPARQGLVDEAVTVETLVEPSENETLGALYRVRTSHNAGGTLILVHPRTPGSREIRYSIVYGEVEIEKLSILCESSAPSGTRVEIREVIMGLSPSGNKAVSDYVARGGVENAIVDQRDAISAYLKRQAADDLGSNPQRKAKG